MHQNSEAKQPKETDEIKKKLESYAALHRRIDNQIERLENLEAVMGSISSPSFDGISGGGGDGTSKQEQLHHATACPHVIHGRADRYLGDQNQPHKRGRRRAQA